MRDIFTYLLEFDESAIADTSWVYKLSADLWQPQEDIRIIGFSLQIEMCAFVQVDGEATAYTELSQSGLWNKPGILGRARAYAEYRSLLGAQEIRIYSTEWMHKMFPAGFSVPIAEGGNLYIHCQYMTSDVGHTYSLGTKAIIYYVKGK